MKPGVYSDLSNADYHGGLGVSKSMLDVLAERSPLHLHYLRTAANDNERQPTPAQRTGTMFHALLLEPEEFDRTHVLPCVVPEGALVTVDDIKAVLKDAGEKVTGTKSELTERLKAVRPEAIFADEVKQQFAISNAGRTIMTTDEWEQLRNMRDAVMAHPAAFALLTRANDVVVDVKTTDDASPEEFARSVAKWRYHVQQPFYLDGLRETIKQSGMTEMPKGAAELSAYWVDPFTKELCRCRPDFWRGAPNHFLFMVVEKTACVVNGQAKGVAVYSLEPEDVQLGRLLYQRDLNTYAKCNASGVWPGYGDKIQPLKLPAYEHTKNAHLLGAA